jgi:hypothetical protein
MEEQREGNGSVSVRRRRATPSPRFDEESFLTPVRQTERGIPRPLIRSIARSVDEESFSTPPRQRERVVRNIPPPVIREGALALMTPEHVERINTRHYLNRGVLPEDIPSFPSGRIQWAQERRAQYYAELAQDRAAQGHAAQDRRAGLQENIAPSEWSPHDPTTPSSSYKSPSPRITISQEHIDDGEMPRCAVCITDFEISEEVRPLHCHHFFHPTCISKWFKSERDALKQGTTCPICRRFQEDLLLAQPHNLWVINADSQ